MFGLVRALIIASLLSNLTIATQVSNAESNEDCACHTYTHTAQPTNQCPRIHCPPRPLCLRLQATTVPGPNPSCTATPTITVPGTCITTCQRGCGTSFTTVTANSPCLEPGPHIGNPPFLLPTPTSYKPSPPPSAQNPPPTPPPSTTPLPSTTTASVGTTTTSCWTYTKILPLDYCPGFKGARCPRPMCILQKTITFPAKNPDCPETRTVTATPSCLNQCGLGCGTAYKTVTLSARASSGGRQTEGADDGDR